MHVSIYPFQTPQTACIENLLKRCESGLFVAGLMM